MKNITFIISSLNSGGAERVISIISKSLSQHFNVSIILLLNGFPRAYDIDKNVSIIECPKFRGKFLKWINIIIYLHKEMKKSTTDVYISFCTIENIVSLIANIHTCKKLIISERNSPIAEKKNSLIKLLKRVFYQKCDWIVFQTKQAQFEYLEKIRKKSSIIPNPIISSLPKWDFEHLKPIICSVGRLAPQKNYPFLLKTFKLFSQEYPQFKLQIFGEGDLKNDLINLCDELGIKEKVVFKGNQKGVHEMIKDNYMYIMTSDYEGMPNSLMEAMGIGIPCISTDCPSGGPKQLITDNVNGYLVEMNNIDQLLNKMKQIISSEDDEILMISKNARKIMKKYDIKDITLLWKSCIDRVLL